MDRGLWPWGWNWSGRRPGARRRTTRSPRRLGLPALPLVEWIDEEPAGPGVYWKTGTVLAWAAGRPFAWFDDEITERDQAWVSERSPAPALLRRVEPGGGLGPADYAAVREWARGLEESGR